MMFLCLFFFRNKFFFFFLTPPLGKVGRRTLQNVTKHKHIKKICGSAEMFDSVFTRAIFSSGHKH